MLYYKLFADVILGLMSIVDDLVSRGTVTHDEASAYKATSLKISGVVMDEITRIKKIQSEQEIKEDAIAGRR